MSRVVTLGEIMLRLTPVGYNRFFQNDQMLASFGGAEANVAVSLSNFGVNTSFVTKLPNNPIGDGAVAELRKFGVNTENISRGGNRIGIYYLEKGASQRGSLCVYDRKNSSISEATPDEFDWNQIFAEDTQWFHFTGITPALSENTAIICEEACKVARHKGITVSCDLNYRSKLWSREKAKIVMGKLCQYVDLCIANEEDARDVFGINAGNTDIVQGIIDKKGFQTAAIQLSEFCGFKKVAFTLRNSISASDNNWSGILWDNNRLFTSKEYHLHIVDRVGGGDSFGAGLIYAYLNGFDGQQIIEFATAASVLKHSIEGDFNRVSVDEVNTIVSGIISGRVSR